MIRLLSIITLVHCTLFAPAESAASTRSDSPLRWSRLPSLPDEFGFAGAFAGVSANNLIVAGGANFPDGYPWDGGAKAYHDRIFILDDPSGSWRLSPQTLPRPVAYGVSITVPARDSIICIGGNDASESLPEVYEIRYIDQSIRIDPLPPLPVPATMACGALIGDTVYVAGGASNGVTHTTFVKLDLSVEPPSWESLPWPPQAPGRILAVSGVMGDNFHLFGGADLESSHWDRRTYLSDAWVFNTKSAQWNRLADLPRHVTAAPSPALAAGDAHLLILGGVTRQFVDARRAVRPETDGNGIDHPGFSKSILTYHSLTGTWAGAGTLPDDAWAPVTTPVVVWNGRHIIPTGEIKPGIRSPQILAAEPAPLKRAFGVVNWAVVVVYLAGMVYIGFWFSKRGRSTDDYFRGGQRIPWWVAGLSIFATMLSAITFMAVPARAYATDISWYIGQLPILIVVPLVVIFYLPRFRKLDITSAYEFLEDRFNLPSRVFASLSFILYHVGRIAIVLYLPAIALAQVSSVNVVSCIVIIGVLCVIYTVMGGIEAVVWTDAVQAIVLLGGALLCLLLVVLRVDGGLAAIWDISLSDAKLFQSLTSDFNIASGTTSWIILFLAFSFNVLVPYTSGQDVVQRYVTTATEHQAARSLWTTMWMSTFGSMIFFALGIGIYAFYKSHPALLDPAMTRNDGILPFFILQQLPVGVAGLLVAAIFAASQSTVSSSLNSLATAYVTDFHSRIFRPDSSDKTNLRVARFVVSLAGIAGIVVACVMAESRMESAFKTFNTLIGLTAGSLGGLFALGVFNKHANGFGAFWGALIAFATVIVIHLLRLPVTGLLYAGIGFTTCFLTGSLLSLIPRRQSA